jgi:hypothetical protein
MGAFETRFLKVCPGEVGRVQARAPDGPGNPRLLQVGVAEFRVGEAGTQDSTSGSLLPKGGMGRSPVAWRTSGSRAWMLRCWSALTTVPCLGAAQVVAGVPAAVHGTAAGIQRGRCRRARMPRRQSWVSAVPGRAGSRCPAGRLRCPCVRTAATSRLRRPGRRDQHRRASATWAALPWCRNGGSGSAAVLPQPAAQPDTAAGVQGVAEPDPADAWMSAAASGTAVGVRTVGRCPDG